MAGKFREVKCLLLPAPEQPLSSSLGTLPSFPEGIPPVPGLPKVSSILHNLTAACWSCSRAQLPGQWHRRQLCKPAGLARPPRSCPRGREAGAAAHLTPAGHWEVSRGRVCKGQTITLNIKQRETGAGIWELKAWRCYGLRLAFSFCLIVAWCGKEIERGSKKPKAQLKQKWQTQYLWGCKSIHI